MRGDLFGDGGAEAGPGVLGKADGVVVHVQPIFVGVLEGGFFLDGGNGLQHELAEISHGGGVALGDPALGEGGEDLAEDVVDVGGVVEAAGKSGGDFGAKPRRFQELLLFTGVEDAEGGMVFFAEHTAGAAVGELAETLVAVGVVGI